MLTVDQKQQSVDVSERYLQLFQRNKKYVTIEETWINHFTLESNRQSAEWTAANESRPNDQRRKHQLARFWLPYFGTCKVFFFFFIDYPEEEKNHQYRILYRIIGAFEERNHQKMATNEEEKVLFHLENAPFHKSIATITKLYKLHFELLWLQVNTGCSTKKASNCWKSLEPVYHLIIIIMSHYQHRYSWPSHSTPPHCPLLSADPQG